MQRILVEEFYRELDATREDYVRHKFATGGYAGWKSKHAKQWLDGREAAAKTKREESVRFWTIVVGITGIAGLLITGASSLVKG
ncbi:hypothetical protein [Roseateles sp.]|uniref:hypothetical protein n=1 Tax=Roseateles sp. TaxID=1971397 RepID=UPI002F3F7144